MNNEWLQSADSVEKLFLLHPKNNFGGASSHQPNCVRRLQSVLEVSVFEVMMFELPKRVFQHNRPILAIHESTPKQTLDPSSVIKVN